MQKAKPLGPTPERMARGDIEVIDTMRAGVQGHIARVQDALDGYYARRQLADTPAENARLYEAGKRLRDAWHESGLAPMMTGSYASSVQSGRDPDGRMVRAIDRSKEWRRLIWIVGPFTPYCMTACCFGLPVGEGVSMRGLKEGLARLADELRC